MAKSILSTKRLQINKANATMVAVVSAAAFISVFSLIGAKTLLSQRSYQARVISEKKKALKQLKANNIAATQLISSYQVFVGTPDNVIGGTATGTGDKDGDNAKIILDALPSKYDFPALATSIEKILLSKNHKINAISGTDDELAQSGDADAVPVAVEMPFEINVSANFASAQELVDILQRSIRPIKIDKLSFSGSDNTLIVNITARTYYQPSKSVQITTKVVK